jgi:hypothetical protein
MLNEEVKRQIIAFIEIETSRMQYGKVMFEITIHNSRVTNIQAETKRSQNINESELLASKRPLKSFH